MKLHLEPRPRLSARFQSANGKLLTDCTEALQRCPPAIRTRVQLRNADLAIGRHGNLPDETIKAPIVVETSSVFQNDLSVRNGAK